MPIPKLIDEMNALLRRDEKQYVVALQRAMGPFLQTGADQAKDIASFPEPVSAIARRYLKDLGREDSETPSPQWKGLTNDFFRFTPSFAACRHFWWFVVAHDLRLDRVFPRSLQSTSAALPVPDDTTADLMSEFWKQMIIHRRPAQALRQAQKEIIRRLRQETGIRKTAHPWFWAAPMVTRIF